MRVSYSTKLLLILGPAESLTLISQQSKNDALLEKARRSVFHFFSIFPIYKARLVHLGGGGGGWGSRSNGKGGGGGCPIELKPLTCRFRSNHH